MNPFEQLVEELLKGTEKIFSCSLEFAGELISGTPRKNKEYKADFAPASSVLSGRNYGFCLTGRKNLSIKDSYSNALVIGGTGSGKSSVVLIPSLYTMYSSFIIHDPSGELYKKCAGYLEQNGYVIKVLNFSNASASSSYNPLARARTSSDIQKIASLLVETSMGGKSKDPFWLLLSISLLTILISILKKQEPQFQNLFNVRQLLNQMSGNPKSVDALFSKDADETLWMEYKGFISYDEKVVNGVIATCKAALQIFSDESVAQVTSFDDLDFNEFRDKPVALFIQNSVSDQRYYSVLTSLFFEQFFAYALGRFPNENEQDIFLLIDEASSLNLPTLPLAVANVRKHRVGIMLLLQDFNQLVHQYGKYNADAIRSNCNARLFFTGQSLEMTKELEQMLGLFEYENDKGQKITRPLMKADELRTMPSDRALLICGNSRPIIAKLKAYYHSRVFNEYSEIPCPTVVSKNLSPTVPVLPLTEPIRVYNNNEAA